MIRPPVSLKFHLRLALSLTAALVPAAVTADERNAASQTADEAHRTYLETLRQEKKYPTAVSCSQCHPDHYEEWSVSPHAYASLSPVFNSMHSFIGKKTSGTVGDFCIRCHTPVGMEREENIYGSVLMRSPSVVEGVTCVACHRVSSEFGTASGRFSMETGPLSDPVYGPTGNKGLKKAIADPEFGLITDPDERGKLVHRDAIPSPVISRSAQCGTCHDVNSPNGLRLESAFTEFKHAPAAKEGTSCQDCHMGLTPGKVLPPEERFDENGRDRNYAFEPVARVRNSPRDRTEGRATPPRKRTNHMFMGPDYSIVHPGIFPHSLAAAELTYRARFRKVLAEENEELMEYLKSITDDDEASKRRRAAEKEDLAQAARQAWKHALPDWLSFRYWEGWGSESFEEDLSEEERRRRLDGACFPWTDPDNEIGASLRRRSARLILSRQFNLLNRAHVERTRILRRGIQLGEFAVTRDSRRGLEFHVDVHNPMKGHAVPTGFDAERIMFLQVTVRDALGRVLFRSGDRDPNGDIRDIHSAYVHASAPKTGPCLDVSAWKTRAGLPLRKDDLHWRPDPFLFSLQSKFVLRNLGGGETEQIIAVNSSLDPVPFLRPPATPNIHTGAGGGVRKQFRTIPPLSKRRAKYRLDPNQLTGTRPYRVDLRFISQMVPVNLVKKIAPVGFDMNLSPLEVAKRVAYGHRVNAYGERRGGAVTLWEHTIPLEECSEGMRICLNPSERDVLHVPVADYPFPHTPAEELELSEAALGGGGDPVEFLIQKLGPYLPEMWPGGVPAGLSLVPEDPVVVEETGPEEED